MPNPTARNKIMTTHPRTGTRFTIDEEIYEPFKTAILQSLKGGKGKTFTELTNDVRIIIKKELPDFKRSVAWYTISIRLDLETKGIIETFTEKGKKWNRLKK
ncbi:MAG: hypothetical protein IPH18_10730 [Chitinophagaceae bacterium]|nr:hypothetical protein [Chitinophagaceae bacterium]MBK8951983.1 hypothetical protein [Chitinophagaceae bacterium]